MTVGKKKSGHELLAERLSALGWTHVQLADAVGVSESIVSRWVAGKRVPKIRSALKLQRVIGLSVEVW